MAEIRELTDLAALHAAADLFAEIWRPGPGEHPANADVMRALSKAGNYIAGAYEGDQLVGAAVAFFGPPAARLLHSHIAGVVQPARGLGLALKLHQRDWARARGVTTIEWTYDPLVSRNAYFNLVKLGALPVEYLPNFYGDMQDGINAGDESDRLLVHWDLTGPEAGSEPAIVGLPVALGRSADGRPVTHDAEGETVLVAVPSEIEKLRAADPALAREWRLAVRSALAGARITGFARQGWYVVTREAQR
jgi:predicted GNAT superfamily acetyltransferase